MNSRNWLGIAEYVSLAGTVAGTAVAAVSQQVIYAAVPVSLSLALNLANRQRFERRTGQQTAAALTKLDRELSSLEAAKQQWSEALKAVISRLEREAEKISPSQNFTHLSSEIDGIKGQQNGLEEFVARQKIQLDALKEEFKTRPELAQIESLTGIIVALQQYLNQLPPLSDSHAQMTALQQQLETAIASIPARVEAAGDRWVEEINQRLQVTQQPYEYQLVSEPDRSKNLLETALETATSRLIAVGPWLKRSRLDSDTLQKFRALLDRQCCLDIGWGNGSDSDDAVDELLKLAREYPSRFRLKLLGTHENFLVCDKTFAWVGSHDALSSGVSSDRPEVGARTTDPRIIEELIQRFEEAKPLHLPSAGSTGG